MMSVKRRRGPGAAVALLAVLWLAGCAGEDTPEARVPGEILYARRDVSTGVDTLFAYGPDGVATPRLELPGALADGRASVDRRQVAYIVNLPGATGGQVLQVASLAPDAQPLAITATEKGKGLLYGLAWSGDGKQLAYGKEVGQLNLSNPAAIQTADAWEMHVVDLEALRAGRPDADRVVWRIAGDEVVPAVYRLEAWDPAAHRAAVSLRHGQLFYAHALRLVDTATGQAVGADIPTRFAPLPFVDLQSPDRTTMLVPESALTGRDDLEELFPKLPNGVSRLRLADGRKESWYALGTSEPTWAQWSPDGRRATWLEIEQIVPAPAELATPGNPTATPPGQATPTIDPKALEVPDLRARMVDGATGQSVWDSPGATVAERVMTFSPDGRDFALARAGATRDEPYHLALRSVAAPSAEAADGRLDLPAHTVWVLWLDRAAPDAR